VSNGRVEFGTGESSAEAELGGFLIPREDKRAMWQESLGAICRMFVENPFLGHEGKYFKMPVRNVVPKPVQKPHPPLWVACSRRETIHLAAKLGIGALTFAFVSPEEARQWVNDYYTTLENECEPIGYAVNANIAIVTGFMCDPSQERAVQMGEEGLKFFSYALGHHYVFGKHEPGKTDIWRNYKQSPINMPGAGGENACVGTPDLIRKRLREYEEAGVDQVVFISQAGNNKHEDICSSLNLFAEKVLPEFKEREDKRTREKAERMAPIVEKVMKRKKEPAVPKAESTVIQAGMLP
jgi:alkanesulfonate monooxygenase SsuD/methylene tetrahydromethanopterin reductase-like flavin-dependent oxidoreductase (luciferase family)